MWKRCAIFALLFYGHICKSCKTAYFMNERERIELLMKCYNLSPSQLADKTGIQRASVSHILSGRNKPSLDVMIKIYDAFPGVDMKWLMTGVGIEPTGHDIKSSEAPSLFSDDTQLSASEITEPENRVKSLNTQPAVMPQQLDSYHQSVAQMQQPKTVQPKQQRRVQQSRQAAPLQAQQRRIKEIRIFYSDGTYETLYPEK